MAEENTNDAPRTSDAGIDNGAALDPRATIQNEHLSELNARVLQLQEQKDSIVEEIRQLNAERQTLAAGEIWSQKVENMNDAEVKALEQVIRQRQSNAQRVGVEGIQSREGVNGQE